MNIVEKAIIFAAKAHKDQTRKSTDIPYITHPYSVGMLLQKIKCSEEVIAAGILHDTLEDTSATYEDLLEQFGANVAHLVLAATETNKSLPWEERKQQTIAKLKESSLEEIQIIVADKLHNLRTIREDIKASGDRIWERFNRGKQEQRWYYTSIVKELAPRRKESKLIRELEKEVKKVFGSLKLLSDEEITHLFSCAYEVGDEEKQKLEELHLLGVAEALTEEANRIYKEEYEEVLAKLDDLSSRGIQFQSNSEGPFILASYSIALQRKMNWTNKELYKQIKRSKLNLL